MPPEAVQDDGDVGVFVGIDTNDGLTVQRHVVPLVVDAHGRGRAGVGQDTHGARAKPLLGHDPGSRLGNWTPERGSTDQRVGRTKPPVVSRVRPCWSASRSTGQTSAPTSTIIMLP